MLRKQDEMWMSRHDISSPPIILLGRWATRWANGPVANRSYGRANHWPLLANWDRLAHPKPCPKFCRQSRPQATQTRHTRLSDVWIWRQSHQWNHRRTLPNQWKGMLMLAAPLPTWVFDHRLAKWRAFYQWLFFITRWQTIRNIGLCRDGWIRLLLYSGRTDDVINVAGHRLGTKKSRNHRSSPQVAESAVVGIHDELKGELTHCLLHSKNHDLVAETENRFRIEQQIVGEVARQLGALAKPAAIYFPNFTQNPLRQNLTPLYQGTGGRQRKTGDMEYPWWSNRDWGGQTSDGGILMAIKSFQAINCQGLKSGVMMVDGKLCLTGF